MSCSLHTRESSVQFTYSTKLPELPEEDPDGRALKAEPADKLWTRKKWNSKNFVDLYLLPQYEWSSLAEKFE